VEACGEESVGRDDPRRAYDATRIRRLSSATEETEYSGKAAGRDRPERRAYERIRFAIARARSAAPRSHAVPPVSGTAYVGPVAAGRSDLNKAMKVDQKDGFESCVT
jgi:hypothetical protein